MIIGSSHASVWTIAAKWNGIFNLYPKTAFHSGQVVLRAKYCPQLNRKPMSKNLVLVLLVLCLTVLSRPADEME